VILGSDRTWTLLNGPRPSRDTLENKHWDSSPDLLFVQTKRFLISLAGRNVYLSTHFRAEGVFCGQSVVANEPDALLPARLRRRSQVRPPATRPPPRQIPADGDGRRLRRPAAPVAGVYHCAPAPGDGARHGGRGFRANKPPPPPPPRSDRLEPPPPASTTAATADCPPPLTRRGGGPQLAGHGWRDVGAANRKPHCPPNTQLAAHRPHDAIPRTGRHPRPLPPHNATAAKDEPDVSGLGAEGWPLWPPAARRTAPPPLENAPAPRHAR